MEIKRFNSYEASSQAIAEVVAELISQKPDALLCFPAGKTSIGVFEALCDMQSSGKCDFSHVKFAALDEWLDLDDESENCTAFMKKNFYDPLHIKPEQIRLFDIHNPNRQQMLEDMDTFILENGAIDFMLLGIGMNGHLGLNEPGVEWEQYSMIAELDSVTAAVGQKYFSSSINLTRGVSLGMKHIFNTKTIILQVSGTHKRDIVKKLINCEPSTELPASALKLMDNAYLYLDATV